MGFLTYFTKKENSSMEQSFHVANLADSMNSQVKKQSAELTQTLKFNIYKLEDLIAMRLGQGLMLAPYDAQFLFIHADDSIKRYLPNMDFPQNLEFSTQIISHYEFVYFS